MRWYGPQSNACLSAGKVTHHPSHWLPQRGHKLPVQKPSVCTGGDSERQAYTQSCTQTCMHKHVQCAKTHTVTAPISTCAWTSLCSTNTVIRFTSRLCKPSSSKDKHSLFSQTSIEVIFKALQPRNENHFLPSWIQKFVLMLLRHFLKYFIPGKQILTEKSSNLFYLYIMKIQFQSNILWDSDDTFWIMFFFFQQDSAETLSHSLK